MVSAPCFANFLAVAIFSHSFEMAACHLFASIVFVKRVLHVKIFLAGGRCPPDPPVFGWGGKAPPDPPLKRSFVTFDRGGQTGPPRSNDFFSAPLTTRAPPTTVRRPSDDRPPAPRNHVTPCSCYPQYRELSCGPFRSVLTISNFTANGDFHN